MERYTVTDWPLGIIRTEKRVFLPCEGESTKRAKRPGIDKLGYFLIGQPVQENFTSDILMCSLLCEKIYIKIHIFRSPNSFKASVNAATGTPSNHSKV